MSLYVNPDSVVDFTTDSEYWIYRLITDAEKHPGEIRILEMPSGTCSTIHAIVPNKYLDVREEQIQLFGGNREWKKT